MASVTDGTYRISIGGILGAMDLADDGSTDLVALPALPTDVGDIKRDWMIKATGEGRYTIATPSGQYAGWEDDPEMYEPIRLYPTPTEWVIFGGDDGAFFIVSPTSGLTLGFSPVLLFPPRVALSPRQSRDKGWTFRPV